MINKSLLILILVIINSVAKEYTIKGLISDAITSSPSVKLAELDMKIMNGRVGEAESSTLPKIELYTKISSSIVPKNNDNSDFSILNSYYRESENPKKNDSILAILGDKILNEFKNSAVNESLGFGINISHTFLGNSNKYASKIYLQKSKALVCEWQREIMTLKKNLYRSIFSLEIVNDSINLINEKINFKKREIKSLENNISDKIELLDHSIDLTIYKKIDTQLTFKKDSIISKISLISDIDLDSTFTIIDTLPTFIIVITKDDYIDRIKNNNKDLTTLASKIEEIKILNREHKSKLYPTITGGIQSGAILQHRVDGDVKIVNDHKLYLSANYNLPIFGKEIWQSRVLKLEKRKSEELKKFREKTIIDEFKALYKKLKLEEKQYKIILEELNLTNLKLETIKNSFKLGISSKKSLFNSIIKVKEVNIKRKESIIRQNMVITEINLISGVLLY